MAGTLPTRKLPPGDYSVIFPEVIDFHTKHNPAETIYTFSSDEGSPPSKISFLEFGRATDRVAHYIRPGRMGPDRQTIAFVAHSDTLLYEAVTIGITRAGFIPYPMSPRNTAAAIIKLMKDTSCHRLLTTQHTLRSLVDDVQAQVASSDSNYALQIDEVPSVSTIFPKLGHERADDPFEKYPSGKRPDIHDTLLYLHSSGSTGLPKTIPQTFKSMVDWANLPVVTGMCNFKVPVMLSGHALPPFHAFGIIAQTLISLYAMVPIGLFPPSATDPHLMPMLPTPHYILDHIRRTGCNALAIIPTFLQIWAQDNAAVQLLANLDFVCFSGGSVPSKLGNFLVNSGVNLIQIYGATELGALTHCIRKEGDEKDWEYMSFSERAGIRWDPQGDGTTYEMQVLTTPTHQVSFENLPGVKGYATSDLFIQHPTKPYLWKIIGRKDDVIIHTSGEKTVPGPIEDILNSSPYILGAVVFGRERDQAGVLLELQPEYQIDARNEKTVVETRNMLWPIVEDANKVSPAFSRIFKEMILIASRDKPLPRAGKGTVTRKAALVEYQAEIDELYVQVEATTNSDTVVPPPSWNVSNIAQWLKSQIAEILLDVPVSMTEDLFEQGLDSLSATILRRRLVGAMTGSGRVQKAGQLVSQMTIYEHPSIGNLAEFIACIVKDPDNFALVSTETEAIELMISKYSAGLPGPIERPAAVPDNEPVVLLTGSTGNLGSQILESLLRDPKVKTVYTLNRPSRSKTVQSRHAERFADKGLDVAFLSSNRLVYLEGETTQKNLGLKDEVYEELLNTVTIIIHNAWRLDFNLLLSAFEPNIQGTRHLIDLGRSSDHCSSLKFLFTSSIASATSWDKLQGPYPEEIVRDSKSAVGNGYGEGKYVAERILEQSGLQATSFRIGQISGGNSNGAWATSDWVPILVKSATAMKALPAAVGVISWLPMDSVAQAILDVVSSSEFYPALNIVHPRPISWNAIFSSINDALVQEGTIQNALPLVDFQAWVTQLVAHADRSSSETINNIPAIKLLDFFCSVANMDALANERSNDPAEVGGWTIFSTDKIQGISETMRSLSKIGAADAQRWVKYWKGVGFI